MPFLQLHTRAVMEYLKHRFSFTQVDEEEDEGGSVDQETRGDGKGTRPQGENMEEKKGFLDTITSKKDSLFVGISSKLRGNQENRDGDNKPGKIVSSPSEKDPPTGEIGGGNVPHAAGEEETATPPPSPAPEKEASVFSALATKLKMARKASESTEAVQTSEDVDQKRFVWRRASPKSYSTDYESDGDHLSSSVNAAESHHTSGEEIGVFAGLLSKLKPSPSAKVEEEEEDEIEGEDDETVTSSATDKFWALTSRLKGTAAKAAAGVSAMGETSAEEVDSSPAKDGATPGKTADGQTPEGISSSVPFWGNLTSKLKPETDDGEPSNKPTEEVSETTEEKKPFWGTIASRFKLDSGTDSDQDSSVKNESPQMSRREQIWNGITSKLRKDSAASAGTSPDAPSTVGDPAPSTQHIGKEKEDIWTELTSKLQGEKPGPPPRPAPPKRGSSLCVDEEHDKEDRPVSPPKEQTFWNGITSKIKGSESVDESQPDTPKKTFWGGFTSKIKEQTTGRAQTEEPSTYAEISSSPAKVVSFWGGITSKLKPGDKDDATGGPSEEETIPQKSASSPKAGQFWSGITSSFQSTEGQQDQQDELGKKEESGRGLFSVVRKKWASMNEGGKASEDTGDQSPSPGPATSNPKEKSRLEKRHTSAMTMDTHPGSPPAVSPMGSASSTSSLIKIDRSREDTATNVGSGERPMPAERGSRVKNSAEPQSEAIGGIGGLAKAAEEVYLQQQQSNSLVPRRETPILSSPNGIVNEFRFSVDEPDVNGNSPSSSAARASATGSHLGSTADGNLMEFGSRASLSSDATASGEQRRPAEGDKLRMLSVEEAGFDSDMSSEPEYSDGPRAKPVLQTSVSVESLDEVSKECRDFADEFVTKVFQNDPITPADKAVFGELIQNGLFRHYFARSINMERSAQQKVSESVYYQLVQYFALILFECGEADDFTPAKTLMNMCFTFYYEVPLETGVSKKQFLYTSLKSQQIWQSMRFWNSAFYEAVQMERCKKPLTTNSDEKEAVEDDREFQENVFFGQLGTFLHNMCEFGISRPWCMEFLRKQSTIGNLKPGQVRMLRSNVERWTDVTLRS